MRLLLGLIIAIALSFAMAPGTGRAASSLPGDLDGDCIVSVVDLAMIAGRYGTSWGMLAYSRAYDFDGDGTISIMDIQFVAGRFMTTCE